MRYLHVETVKSLLELVEIIDESEVRNDSADYAVKGSVVFKGTKIAVSYVANYLQTGRATKEEFRKVYPELSMEMLELAEHLIVGKYL